MADKTAITAAGERAAPHFEVHLIKPHTHERVDLQPGATIKITAEQRTWLQSLGVIASDTQEK